MFVARDKTQGATQTRPLQLQDPELPNPAHDPDLFAHVRLGIDWVENNFLAELKAFRADLIQKLVTTPQLSGTLPEREARKKEKRPTMIKAFIRKYKHQRTRT